MPGFVADNLAVAGKPAGTDKLVGAGKLVGTGKLVGADKLVGTGKLVEADKIAGTGKLVRTDNFSEIGNSGSGKAEQYNLGRRIGESGGKPGFVGGNLGFQS